MFIYHPHELWLKGKNRPQFEKILRDNLSRQMRAAGITSSVVSHSNMHTYVTAAAADEQKVIDVSRKVFGIANFSKCYKVERDMEVLKTAVVEYFNNLNSIKPVASFKVETTRPDKRYPIQSPEMSKIIGGVINDECKIPAQMKDPEITLHIEIQTEAFVFFGDKIPGALGLPVGSSGRSIMLISGGFDSPVASWMTLQRGCSLQYVHFHSAPFGEWRSSVAKVRKIVQLLALWGGPIKFFCVPIGEQQRQIALDAPPKLRVTLYRRLMFRIAKEIAEKQNCNAITTGDSLGQVASQTIESMTTIQECVQPMLVMRPLIGFSKQSIMKKAMKIGTHDLSILAGGDCCSHLLPKKVATKPTIEEAIAGESKLDINAMVADALSKMQLVDINEPWNENPAPDEPAPTCSFTFTE